MSGIVAGNVGGTCPIDEPLRQFIMYAGTVGCGTAVADGDGIVAAAGIDGA